MNNKAELMSKGASSDSVLINEITLATGNLYKYKHLLINPKCWHQFVINNTGDLTRDEILETILDHIHPCDLIPVFFSKDSLSSNSYFLARNCEAAVQKICKDNLTIDHPYNKIAGANTYKPFKINIVLNFSNTNEVKIDVQKNVLIVLQKRMNIPEKVLDLDRFAKDKDLTEYCPLSQPKIMYFVLHISKTLSPEELILSNNNIKICSPLEVLFGMKLKRIDLSNNEIKSFDDLMSLKHFNIKELKLSGNPLCNCDESEYISKAKEICPGIEFLDGMPLSRGKLPMTKRNYLCDDNSFDLVNQFLEYFFTVYDSKDRRLLSGLYHTEALFSLTTIYVPNQLSSTGAHLRPYSIVARNLKKSADFSKTTDFIFKGRQDICNLFMNQLPQTEHDPYSFSVDLVYKTDKCAVIVVMGVYKEFPLTLLDNERTLGFTRSFVLELFDDQSRAVITNEQLHVYNALSYQERNAFQDPRVHTEVLIPQESVLKAQNEAEHEELVFTLGQITKLKVDWSRKCLEECNYVLKEAIELFVDLYKADKFPKHAFVD